MGKLQKYVSKGKMKPTSLRSLTWQMTPGDGEKGREGGGTMALNIPFMLMIAATKFTK